MRFPEFEGEWERKKLGEIAERVTRKNKENNLNVLTISAQFGLISQLEFFNKSVSAKDVTGYYLLHKNDFAYNKSYSNGYPMGAIKRLNRYEKGVVSTLYICFKFNDSINNAFVEQSFETGNQNSEIEKVAQEGARNHGLLNIGVSDFFNIEITIPFFPEQTQIASFLSLIDNQIQCQSKIIEGLKSLKRAMSRKIFSQKLRFKDENGKEFPEWEDKKLGEVCIIIMGQSPSSTSYNTDKIGIPLIQGNADIQNRYSLPRNWTTEKTKECQIGDLILTVRAPVGAVAKSMHNACIGRGVCAIRNNLNSSLEYIYQFLLDFENQWGSLEQGSTFTAVSGNEINKIKICAPSLPEQTKIANFLSGIDEKIDLETSLLQQLKLQKQYLLQQMFI